jgi:hypothetical protein
MPLQKLLLAHNNNMVFTYISGSHTDSSEKGSANVGTCKRSYRKRFDENCRLKVNIISAWNMLPFDGQKNWKSCISLSGKF